MIKDVTQGKLSEALEFAKSINDTSLQDCIDRLNAIDKNCDTETTVMEDYAPRSFYFERYDKEKNFRGNGGIIFHGHHDGYGSGSVPTFSVTLTPTKGWCIHT